MIANDKTPPSHWHALGSPGLTACFHAGDFGSEVSANKIFLFIKAVGDSLGGNLGVVSLESFSNYVSLLWRKCMGIEPTYQGFSPVHRI